MIQSLFRQGGTMRHFVGILWACAIIAVMAVTPFARAQQATDAIPDYTGGSRFSCESIDGQRHSCRVDTRGGVVLLRQLSQLRCTRGRTWDFDRQGVWVDAGCRGEFQAGRGDGARAGMPATGGAQTVKCESHKDRQRRCAVAVRHNAVLQQQLHGNACIEGHTWGWDHAGIWVDHGCRAIFAVY